MADKKKERGSVGWGLAKLGAAFASPVSGLVGALAQGDDDVRELGEVGALAAGKRLIANYAPGAVPSEKIMSRVNLAGAGLDLLTGQGDDPESTGRKLGRAARGEMRSVEDAHPVAMGVAEGAADVGLGLLGGGGGLAGAANAGAARLAGRVAPSLGRVGTTAASGALTGASSGLYDGAVESAHKQFLDSGEVDYNKVAADAGRVGLAGAVLGGGLGAAGAGVASSLGRNGGKIAERLRSRGANQFLHESGLSGAEVRKVNAQFKDTPKRIEDLLGESFQEKLPASKYVDKGLGELDGAIGDELDGIRRHIDMAAKGRQEAAESAAQVAKRNWEARAGSEAESIIGAAEAKKAPLYQRLEHLESGADMAAARQRVESARLGYEQTRDAFRAQKMAEVEALRAQSVRPQLPAFSGSDELTNAGGKSRPAAEGTQAYTGTRNLEGTRQLEPTQLTRQLEPTATVPGTVHTAPPVDPADLEKQIAKLMAEADQADEFAKKAFGKELSTAEKALDAQQTKYTQELKRLSEQMAKIDDAAQQKLTAKAQGFDSKATAEVEKLREMGKRQAQELAEDIKLLQTDDPAALKKNLDALEKRYSFGPQTGRLRQSIGDREFLKALKDAKGVQVVKLTELTLGDMLHGAKKAVSLASGWGVADWAINKLSPHLHSKGLYKAASLADAAGATLRVDAAAKGAVDSLFGRQLPIAASRTVTPAFLSSAKDKDRSTAAHVQHVAQQTANPVSLTERLAASTAGLPEQGKGEVATKMALVLANIQRRAPKPVIAPSVFGEDPQFSDADVHAYEDYASAAANPAVFMKALRERSATPAMMEAMQENWPELVDVMKQQFVANAGKGEMPDPQSVRHLELLFGEALVPENRKDFRDLYQRAYDQDRRKNMPGSQGGGSPSSNPQKQMKVRTVASPMDQLANPR
jgi:uncharacterized protein (UPF0335 family)